MINMCVMIVLFVLGAMMGSFACCQAWRIRKGDKAKWSHCMNCKYQLQWYDNIPIVSWIALGGKCRKCRHKIGYAEILSEVGVGFIFALSYILWPRFEELFKLDVLEVIKYGLFLINLVMMTILFVYDAKWKELPVKLLYATWVVAIGFLGINMWQEYQVAGSIDLLTIFGALLILPVFYFIMYRISHESWVGGGDWMLCVPLALMLGDFWLAMFAMFAANILGCVTMLPVALSKKDRRLKIPFGPFLILGFLVVFFLQVEIIKFTGIGLL
ncbi:prepilin peptidase [Candidatus Saccharibacteria bacterium]|nr:prepilin peptidase [Candidatus Saccharibacteria bacterium]